MPFIRNLPFRPGTVYFAIALLLFVYIAIRAFTVQLVHDEVATYYHYIMTGRFLPYLSVWDANNHLLNSMLSWLSMLLFGDHPFALRLPNLLSMIIFLYYTYRISGWFSHVPVRLVFVCSLWFTAGLIEFFGLTRGYGMSMAFLMASIWYVGNSFLHPQQRYRYLAVLFMILAVTANLTLLVSMMILMVILFMTDTIFFKGTNRVKRVFPVQLIGWLFILSATFYVFDMKSRGLLYYGTLDGFREETIRSLLDALFGYNPLLLQWVVILMGITSLILAAVYILRKMASKVLPAPDAVFPVLLAGVVAGILLMAWLLKVNYPSDRTGLYLYPYFIGTVCYASSRLTFRSIRPYLLTIPLLVIPVHFFLHINFTHSILWQVDRMPDSFFSYIKDETRGHNMNASVGGKGTFELCWAYENFRHSHGLSLIYFNGYPSLLPDYQVVYRSELFRFPGYKEVRYDEASENSLLERENKLHFTVVNDTVIPELPETTAEYISFYEGFIPDPEQAYQFKYSFQYASPDPSFDGWMVVTAYDKHDKQIYYDRFFLRWPGLTDVTKPVKIDYAQPVPSKNEAVRIICYLWNKDKKPVRIYGGILQFGSLTADE